MSTTWTAASLAEVADYFDTLATDQIGSMRWQKTKREKVDCEVRAATWRDAASMLRKVHITGTTP